MGLRDRVLVQCTVTATGSCGGDTGVAAKASRKAASPGRAPKSISIISIYRSMEKRKSRKAGGGFGWPVQKLLGVSE